MSRPVGIDCAPVHPWADLSDYPGVGQRSAGESIAAIFQAFLTQRTWAQADLAREVGIHVPALKKQLAILETGGLPLTRDEDHPHVYWSVPQNWFPGGVVFDGEDLALLLRHLARAPRSEERDRLITSAARSLTAGTAGLDLSEIIEPADEAEHLSTIEDSARKQTTLHCQYYSAKGRVAWRHISVQRILLGPHARFVGVCHRSGQLKWFRADSVLDARLDQDVPFQTADATAIEAFLSASLDGFADSGTPTTHAFVVRNPEAGWVAKNLLKGMETEEVTDGLRVTAHTTALPILARFVVGLGDAARCESPILAEEVRNLAEGALANLPTLPDQ